MSSSIPATIAAEVEHELVIKKSRFIAQAWPVSSAQDGDEHIHAARKRFWDARHNCTAMVTGDLGEHARSSDDGEPSGTAGVPMMEVLKRRHLTNVVVVVSRYFGGVKLGAGGLVRAYGGAVSGALDQAVIVHRQELLQATVEVVAADAGRVEHTLRSWLAAHDGILEPAQYGLRVRFTAWIAPELAGEYTSMLAATAGFAIPVELGGRKICALQER